MALLRYDEVKILKQAAVNGDHKRASDAISLSRSKPKITQEPAAEPSFEEAIAASNQGQNSGLDSGCTGSIADWNKAYYEAHLEEKESKEATNDSDSAGLGTMVADENGIMYDAKSTSIKELLDKGWSASSILEGRWQEPAHISALDYTYSRDIPPEAKQPGSAYPGQFEKIGAKVGRLTGEKHEAYNRSLEKIGDVLKFFYPDGIKPEQYTDLHIVVRMIDKLFRLTGPDPGAFDESPYKDIAGYAIAQYVIKGGK